MTHHQQANTRAAFIQQEPWPDETPNSWNDLLELLCDRGFEGMAQAMQVLLNEAMKLERTAVLGAQPFERTPRRGHCYAQPGARLFLGERRDAARSTALPEKGVIEAQVRRRVTQDLKNGSSD